MDELVGDFVDGEIGWVGEWVSWWMDGLDTKLYVK